MVLFPAMLVGGHLLIAVVDQVPTLNFEPLCRSGTSKGLGGKDDREVCMQDENAARGQLAKEWGQFAPADRERCVRMSTMDRATSYVEVLTCLEMDLAAKKLHQDEDVGIDAGLPDREPAPEKPRGVAVARHPPPPPVSLQPPQPPPASGLGPLEVLCIPGLKTLISACQH
jgi:hypothetical protein